MGITKSQKRSNKLKERLSEYFHSVMDGREYETTQDKSRHGGIVRDRVAFYIANAYYTNMHLLRNYISPTNDEIDAVDAFLKDDIPYSKVKDFFYRNRELFDKQMHIDTLDTDQTCLAFVIINNGGIITQRGFLKCCHDDFVKIGKQSEATTFTKFMDNEELTKQLIIKYYAPELKDATIEKMVLVPLGDIERNCYPKSTI